MNDFLKNNRFQTMVSIVTGLIMASGCRSASVNSSSSMSSDPAGSGSRSFFRSYERSNPSPSYEDNNFQLPSNEPGAIPPLPPGQSEPTAVPPSPSAQRSKWNKLPSSIRFPSKLKRQEEVVHQTANLGEVQTGTVREGNIDGSSPSLHHQDELSQEETVSARIPQNRTRTSKFDAVNSERPSRRVGRNPDFREETAPAPIITPTPRHERSGSALPARQFATTHTDESRSDAGIYPPANDQNPLIEPPLLLPPDP